MAVSYASTTATASFREVGTPYLPSLKICTVSLSSRPAKVVFPKLSHLVGYGGHKNAILNAVRPKFRLYASEQAVSDQEEITESEEETPETTNTSDEVSSGLISQIKELVDENSEKWLILEDELKSLIKSNQELDLKVASLAEEANLGKERFLRLNADFDNFRKRSEREKIAMASTVRGEVIEDLLPMVDNFERAKSSLILTTEGEKKIDGSYQGIYKQFVEVMRNLGVKAVETTGCEFDPLVHEAIMREESTEFAEGVVIQEFRKGFVIGEKLLRPAMVKVSSGPGPLQSSQPSIDSIANAETADAENPSIDVEIEQTSAE